MSSTLTPSVIYSFTPVRIPYLGISYGSSVLIGSVVSYSTVCLFSSIRSIVINPYGVSSISHGYQPLPPCWSFGSSCWSPCHYSYWVPWIYYSIKFNSYLSNNKVSESWTPEVGYVFMLFLSPKMRSYCWFYYLKNYEIWLMTYYGMVVYVNLLLVITCPIYSHNNVYLYWLLLLGTRNTPPL